VTTLDHRKKGKPVEFFELISACNLFDNNVKKKNAETQERKGLRSRNSKAFYLPCPYFFFFSLNSLGEFVAAATREMHCHRNHKELFLTLA